MLEIINTKGQIMELAEDTAIPVEKNNSMFNDNDQLFIDVSYPFKAPLTPKNKLFFESGHRIDADNSVYEFEVMVYLNSNLLFAGLLSYQFKNGSYDGILKPNYSGVNRRASDNTFANIRWGDAVPVPLLWDPATAHTTFEDYMKDTVQNPDNYQAVFVPIKNVFYTAQPVIGQFMNFYDTSTQRYNNFVYNTQLNQYIGRPEPVSIKLTYAVKKAFEFLGFTVDSSFLNNPFFKERYIYSAYVFVSRRFTGSLPQALQPIFSPLGFYMEDISIGEFLKALKSRYKLAYSVDYFNKKVKITSFSDLKKSNQVLDISKYLESVTEIIKPQIKGLSIYLKPDPQDKLYLKKVGEDKEEAFPTLKLVIGEQQEKEEELKIGTLQQETSENKTYVVISQNLFGSDGTAETRNALRIFKFKGLQTVNGVTHPNTYTDELTLEDADFYSFINTAKNIRAVANLPADLLNKLDIDKKITFTTKEGISIDFIIEQFSYDLTESAYIKVDFKLREVNYNTSTARIEPGFVSEDNLVAGIKVMATFTSLNEVNFDIYYNPYYIGPNPPPPAEFLYSSTITKSTDKFGVGGEIKTFNRLGFLVADTYQIRVYSGTPLWLEDARGNKLPFTQVGSYYLVNLGASLSPYRIVY